MTHVTSYTNVISLEHTAGAMFVAFSPVLPFTERKNFYCWFSHDVTKFQTSELLILLRFYFHDVSEQSKTNIHTNFHSEWVPSLLIDYA